MVCVLEFIVSSLQVLTHPTVTSAKNIYLRKNSFFSADIVTDVSISWNETHIALEGAHNIV